MLPFEVAPIGPTGVVQRLCSFSHTDSRLFPFQAATTFCFTFLERRTVDYDLPSAVTYARPECLLSSAAIATHLSKPDDPQTAHTEPIQHQPDIAVFKRSPVVHLFGVCSPTTVFRRVRAVVVDALKAVRACWFRTHVLQKCGETVPPCFTHGDTTPAVVLVLIVVLAVAPTFGVTPRLVLAGDLAPSGCAMCGGHG